MSGTRDDSILLDDIIDAADRLVELGCDLVDGQEPGRESREGLLYNLIILGEATKRLRPSTREHFSDVSWTDMARTRDRIVHHYEGIDWASLQELTRSDLPALLPRLVEIRDTLRAEYDAQA